MCIRDRKEVIQIDTSKYKWNKISGNLFTLDQSEKTIESVYFRKISLSLSSDGNTLVVGAIYDHKIPGFTGTGAYSLKSIVRIYEYESFGWSMKQSLVGDVTSYGINNALNIIGYFGWSVSLSGNGKILAIGDPLNDGGANNPNINSGSVRLYTKNNSNWEQIGRDIGGELSGDQSGTSVALSYDGSIVAIGGYLNDPSNSLTDAGHVRVYQYINNVWTQLGSDIDGSKINEQFGYYLSLSNDGKRLVSGSRGIDKNISVYDYEYGKWNNIGNNILSDYNGEISGYSVSLSGDGNRIAIGIPYIDSNGNPSGFIRLYEYSDLIQEIPNIIQEAEEGIEDRNIIRQTVMPSHLRRGRFINNPIRTMVSKEISQTQDLVRMNPPGNFRARNYKVNSTCGSTRRGKSTVPKNSY